VTRVGRFVQAVIAVEFAVAVAIIAYAGFHDIRTVFVGAPAGLSIRYRAVCRSADSESPCRAQMTEISPGRFRAATDGPASDLTVLVEGGPIAQTRYLLASTAAPATVRVQSNEAPDLLSQAITPSKRTLISIPTATALESIAFDSRDPNQPMVVTELGVFADDRGLASDARPFFDAIPPQRYHATLIPRMVTRLALFTVLAAFFFPAGWLKRITPVALAVVCFSLCLIDLTVLYSPYTGHDLRAYYASGPLQEIPGSNLNGPIWEAFRFLSGHGFTVADGLVSWAKMPGYGLFAAFAGVLFGHATLLQLVMSTVFLQVLFFSLSVGFFAWAAGKLWSPPVVWTVTLLVALLPKQLGYTQVDSVIAPVALVLLGIICLRLATTEHGRPVSIRTDVGLHLAFALWFLMRPDVLPGWAIVSVALHARQPRRLLLPLAFAAAIGISWAAYKMQYTGEFVPTTSTTGASLVCGLWEAPSKFPWVCSDESYFAWVSSHTTFDPKSAAGGNVVIREVLRFWLIYPGHFVFMIYNKILRCFSGDLWPGIPTDLQQSIFQVVGRGSLILTLATVIVLAIAVGYRRERTLLLSWPILLNAPVFWIMQTSEGRYYAAVGVAILIAAVPLLLDRGFFVRALERRSRSLAVLAGIAVVAVAAWPVHDWLLRTDSVHYWTPFLDPSRSSWGILK
jgi:hypothetical protein